MKQFSCFLTFLAIVAISCTPKTTNKVTEKKVAETKNNIEKMKSSNKYVAPDAKMIKHNHEAHGDIRLDNYHWMRLTDEQKNAANPDAQTQDVLNYLNAENDYTTKSLSHTEALQEKLFNEIVGRIQQTDMSVPYKVNGYYYLTRYEEGKEYPIHSRKKENLEAQEEILLDVNKLAEGYEYYAVSGRRISPNNKILAYGEDVVSRRIYTIRFKNLETGELLTDVIPNTTGSVTWANDNKTVFYSVKDNSLRSYKIFRHTLGTDASEDVEIFHESDETFGTFVYKTKSKKYLVIGSFSTLSKEYRVLDADNPTGEFKVFQPRERNLEYSITHYDGKWYVVNNIDAKNFKLSVTDENNTGKENWKEVLAHRDNVLLEGIEVFKNYMVISERIDGITQIRVIPSKGEEYYLDLGEGAYLAYTSTNPEFDTDVLRYGFTSLTTPNSTFDINLNTREKTLLKQQKVVGDFDSNNYRSERILVPVRDGVKVPVSIVYHKDTKIDGTAPCLLYGYGSYGNSMDPYFSSVRLSLLDRGFVYAIGHIRGGQEMGRHWYEDGKLLKKKNTFNDFIDCGKYLKENGYSSSDKLFGMGGSAGGLLIGTVMNEAPDLWAGVVAAVPFVDVVSTMLDESIPLTTGEFDEWGNPKNKEYYDYIKSYSPYDNVIPRNYPPTLVTTGYFDSQVQYWEPAKWVAKLRDNKLGNTPLYLHTNMGAGHGGASGRFRRFKETALEYAFFLDLAGLVH